ncbi:hypothetical protein BSKO_12907 [Bryopsis sp. KO-2023]|nr:hypothetical protein BSKO_12907 [Bryopsis sp. KO-2023]
MSWARFVVRDREVERTVFQFLKGNWPDVLALTTDIPGVTNMGAIRFLVITRFRHVLRLFRITRILKVFRVVRFYRRFTMQNWFIELMINRPTLFLLLLLCLILIISASFLKILEQNRQESFQSLVNTLWFTLVTITTVGYGDMVPLNVVSRMITAGLMMVGIGILGLLTATLLKKLLMGGQGMAEMEKRKQQNRVRLDLLKTNAAKMTMAYNPMVTVYGEYFSRMFENDSQIREANSAHKSSYLNHDKSVMEDTVMPLEVMMARSATKFRASTQDSSALQDHEIEARNRGARERDILRSLFDDPSAPAISPEIKLHFILRFFKLDEGKDAVKDFEAFHEDLKLILFNEHTPQNLFIARAMALQDEMDDSGNLPVGWKADLKDPIDSVLVRIEETLRRYNVHVRPDFQEIMLEFILLAFMHDRVLNASWALRNLKHTDGATKAFPPIKHGCVKSLGFKSTSWNLESQFSRQELIPKLTFVSRRANLSSTSNIKRNEKEALKKLVVPKLASVVSRVHHLRSINVDQAESSDAKSKWKLVKQKLMPPRRISPTSSEEDAIKATQSLNH